MSSLRVALLLSIGLLESGLIASGQSMKSDAGLSTPKGQAAVNMGFAALSHELNFGQGAGATIDGIQLNLPENSAIADLTFHKVEFRCNQVMGGLDQIWMRGQAVFKRYTDGRWVLTDIISTQQKDSLDCVGHWRGSISVEEAAKAALSAHKLNPAAVADGSSRPTVLGVRLVGKVLGGGWTGSEQTPYVGTTDNIFRLVPEHGDNGQVVTNIREWNDIAKSSADVLIAEGCKVPPGAPKAHWVGEAVIVVCRKIAKGSMDDLR